MKILIFAVFVWKYILEGSPYHLLLSLAFFFYDGQFFSLWWTIHILPSRLRLRWPANSFSQVEIKQADKLLMLLWYVVLNNVHSLKPVSTGCTFNFFEHSATKTRQMCAEAFYVTSCFVLISLQRLPWACDISDWNFSVQVWPPWRWRQTRSYSCGMLIMTLIRLWKDYFYWKVFSLWNEKPVARFPFVDLSPWDDFLFFTFFF